MAATSIEDLLVEQIKSGTGVPLERALLIVSGLEEEAQIAEYTGKIDALQKKFEGWRATKQKGLVNRMVEASRNLVKPADKHYQTAKSLFDFLWDGKTDRYNGNFLLAKVIDSQLSNDKHEGVGNCTGLTSLYSVLGARYGLNLSVLCMEKHVLSVLNVNEKKTFVENTSPYGFGVDLPKGNDYQEVALVQLVATTFNSRGDAKQKLGDLEGAIIDYTMAIELNPDFAKAFYNRGIAKCDKGDLEGAIKDYNAAIESKPDFAEAFNNRGDAKQKLGDLEGANLDFLQYRNLMKDRALNPIKNK